MKKSIIKNVIALTFALGALVFVAVNVFADHTVVVDYIEGQGGTEFISRTRCVNKIASAIWVVRLCAGNIPNSIPSVRCGSLVFFARADEIAIECARN